MQPHQDPRDGIEIQFMPGQIRAGAQYERVDEESENLRRNLEQFRRNSFSNFRRLQVFTQNLLDDEERDEITTLEHARTQRQLLYQQARLNRQPHPLKNGNVYRGSLARRTPLVPYGLKMQATKRRLNQLCLQIPKVNARQLAKKAKSSHWSARKAVFDMVFVGNVCEYNPNQHHSAAAIAELDNNINNRANFYNSSTDHKRILPQFSKRFIRNRIKATGRHYFTKPKKRRLALPAADQRALDLLSTLAQGFSEQVNTLLWFDISEFSLVSSPNGAWELGRERNRPPRPRRDVTKLYLLAICSKEGLVAYKVHVRPVTGQQIKHFLLEVLEKANLPNHVRILLDNSQPNTTLQRRTNITRLLLYNIEYSPQYNLIEMMFSKMKSSWNSRPITPTLRDEYLALTRCINLASCPRDFSGYRRNYLRAIINLCRTAVQPRNNVARPQRQQIAEEEIYMEED
jgi:hypothetical protein